MKEKMMNQVLHLLEKAIEISFESASMYGMFQAEEPEGLEKFIQKAESSKE